MSPYVFCNALHPEGGLSRRCSRHSQHSKRSSLGSGHHQGATTTQADVLVASSSPGASPRGQQQLQQQQQQGLAQHVAGTVVAMEQQHLGVERRLSQLSDNEVSHDIMRPT